MSPPTTRGMEPKPTDPGSKSKKRRAGDNGFDFNQVRKFLKQCEEGDMDEEVVESPLAPTTAEDRAAAQERAIAEAAEMAETKKKLALIDEKLEWIDPSSSERRKRAIQNHNLLVLMHEQMRSQEKAEFDKAHRAIDLASRKLLGRSITIKPSNVLDWPNAKQVEDHYGTDAESDAEARNG